MSRRFVTRDLPGNLINTARGAIGDQAALREALQTGQIAGAALEVTDPRAAPANDPLLQAPGLIVIPHLGSPTHATRERMAAQAVDNLLAGLGAGRRLTRCPPRPHTGRRDQHLE